MRKKGESDPVKTAHDHGGDEAGITTETGSEQGKNSFASGRDTENHMKKEKKQSKTYQDNM
jgi:hypothetical protein